MMTTIGASAPMSPQFAGRTTYRLAVKSPIWLGIAAGSAPQAIAWADQPHYSLFSQLASYAFFLLSGLGIGKGARLVAEQEPDKAESQVKADEKQANLDEPA